MVTVLHLPSGLITAPFYDPVSTDIRSRITCDTFKAHGITDIHSLRLWCCLGIWVELVRVKLNPINLQLEVFEFPSQRLLLHHTPSIMASFLSAQHLTPEILAPLHVYSTLSSGDGSLLPQLAHRIHLVKDVFSIPLGAKVLEIGPGQGDCTIVLAAAVGDKGRVDAVDPGDLEYGR